MFCLLLLPAKSSVIFGLGLIALLDVGGADRSLFFGDVVIFKHLFPIFCFLLNPVHVVVFWSIENILLEQQTNATVGCCSSRALFLSILLSWTVLSVCR